MQSAARGWPGVSPLYPDGMLVVSSVGRLFPVHLICAQLQQDTGRAPLAALPCPALPCPLPSPFLFSVCLWGWELNPGPGMCWASVCSLHRTSAPAVLQCLPHFSPSLDSGHGLHDGHHFQVLSRTVRHILGKCVLGKCVMGAGCAWAASALRGGFWVGCFWRQGV